MGVFGQQTMKYEEGAEMGRTMDIWYLALISELPTLAYQFGIVPRKE